MWLRATFVARFVFICGDFRALRPMDFASVERVCLHEGILFVLQLVTCLHLYLVNRICNRSV